MKKIGIILKNIQILMNTWILLHLIKINVYLSVADAVVDIESDTPLPVKDLTLEPPLIVTSVNETPLADDACCVIYISIWNTPLVGIFVKARVDIFSVKVIWPCEPRPALTVRVPLEDVNVCIFFTGTSSIVAPFVVFGDIVSVLTTLSFINTPSMVTPAADVFSAIVSVEILGDDTDLPLAKTTSSLTVISEASCFDNSFTFNLH